MHSKECYLYAKPERGHFGGRERVGRRERSLVLLIMTRIYAIKAAGDASYWINKLGYWAKEQETPEELEKNGEIESKYEKIKEKSAALHAYWHGWYTVFLFTNHCLDKRSKILYLNMFERKHKKNPLKPNTCVMLIIVHCLCIICILVILSYIDLSGLWTWTFNC